VTKDISDQRFEKLVALRLVEERKNGKRMWECQCDCGKIKVVPGAELVRGRIRSCGCLRSENAKRNLRTAKDLTGQRFGKLVALRPTEERKNRYVLWECQCDCGSTVSVASNELKKGKTKSCGCLCSRTRKEI